MKTSFAIALLFFAFSAFAQLPSTDIFLIAQTGKNGDFRFSAPKNLTAREGYDNQPYFMPDGKTLLYVSVREDKQADVYTCNLRNGHTKRLTNTPEDEFSPILMPDGKHISVVIVEKDSSQRLWKFSLKGKDPELILPHIKNVGYHAWLNDSEVVLYILGDSLQIANIRTGQARTIARNIGRSIQPNINGSHIFYTSKKDSIWYIMDWSEKSTERVVALPKGVEDFAMDGNYNFFSSCDGLLLVYGQTAFMKNPQLPLCLVVSPNQTWLAAADFSKTIGQFYRIALSRDGKWLALVGYTGPRP